MDYYPVKFIGKVNTIKGSVFPYGIYAYEKVSAEAVSFAIIKGYNIRIIIVLQIFNIDIQNIIIGTKYNRNVSQALEFAFGDKFEPT